MKWLKMVDPGRAALQAESAVINNSTPHTLRALEFSMHFHKWGKYPCQWWLRGRRSRRGFERDLLAMQAWSYLHLCEGHSTQQNPWEVTMPGTFHFRARMIWKTIGTQSKSFRATLLKLKNPDGSHGFQFCSRKASICIWLNFHVQTRYNNDLELQTGRSWDVFTIRRQSVWNWGKQSIQVLGTMWTWVSMCTNVSNRMQNF